MTVSTPASSSDYSPSNQMENQNLCKDENDFLLAMQLASGSLLSMVMKVAIELDVFEIIAKAGPGAQLSPTEIVSHLSTQNPNAPAMLDRVLRLLATQSVLTCAVVAQSNGPVKRLYGLAPACTFLVPDEDGTSISPMLLLIQDKVYMDSWYHMKDAILEGGIPFNKAHGMSVSEYPGIDPRFNRVFNKGMFNHTTIVMKKILETYKGFENLKEFVDVGGGIGTTIGIITAKYPSIKGINFDLPHVIKQAPSYPGVEHVGGDMFETVPKAEAIFMKWILHDWNDENCLKILRNCYKAVPDDGKVIVVEAIVPVGVETDSATKGLCQLDLIMLVQTPGAERTQEEFEILAKDAGFACVKKVCCVYNFWVMEFCKK